jgi:protein-S-isoprenylcysteine O-methyltransferase Ste14
VQPVRTAAEHVFAWSGAALFALSLGYFLFAYGVTFGEIATHSLSWRDVGTNLLLFGVFGLHHSVFARPPVRSRVAALLPAHLERSAYVWVASAMLIAVCAWWRPLPGAAWQVDGPAVWPLRALTAAGIWLIFRSTVIIDVWDLAGIRTARQPGAVGPFRAEGPYARVRHPIYAGWFLIVFSVGTMTTTRLLFAVASCAYLLVAIPVEERTLRATSGGAYDRYAQQVRWKLVPGVY